MSTDSAEVHRPRAIAAIPGGFLAGILLGVFTAPFAWLLGFSALSSMGYETLGLLVGPVVAASFGGGVPIWWYLRLKSTRYELHADKVRKESGILSTSITDVGYDQVTDVQYSQSLFNSLFGVGDVEFNTAGGDDKELSVRYVHDARSLYERLNDDLT